MEKKMWKLIGAGLGVILLLAAALILLNNQTVEYESGVTVFLDREPAEIRQLTVTNGSGGFQVFYDDAEEGYVFDDIPVSLVDTEGFFALMNHAGGFGALRTI